MKKTLFISAPLIALGLVATAQADVLAVPDTVMVMPAPAAVPQKGAGMDAVKRQFGEPQQRHPAAGGDAPRHPPITRWDYNGFSVFFENHRVIDTVVAGAPAPVVRTDELVTTAP